MAGINKNFVVKNGLEVKSNLLLADSDRNSVGIGTSNINYKLHVRGGIGATDLIVTGIATFPYLSLTGTVAAGSSLGASGQFLTRSGSGVTWSDFPSYRTSQTFTATSSQTTFAFTYNVGFLDVYINGVRLTETEYTAVDGTQVILNQPCFGDETVDFITYGASAPGYAFTGIYGISVAEEGSYVGTPGGILSLNFVGSAVTAVGSGAGVTVYITDTGGGGESYWEETSVGINTISNVGIATTNPRFSLEVGPVGYADTALWVNGNARVTGILTVGTASIILDGDSNTITVPNLVVTNSTSGVIASGVGITVKSNAVDLGVAEVIDFGGSLNVSFTSGIATVTATGGGESYWSSTSAGIHTLSNVGIGTTNPTSALTVNGTVGITSNVYISGITTFNNQVVFTKNASINPENQVIINSNVENNPYINIGYGSIYYNSPNTIIRSTAENGRIRMDSAAGIDFEQFGLGGQYRARFDNTNVSLYSANSLKFQTIGAGVTVTGTTFTNQLSVSGISTLSSNVSVGGTISIDGGVTLATNNETIVGTSATAGEIKRIGGAPFFYDGSAWREFVLSSGTPVTQPADTEWDNVIFRATFDDDYTDAKFSATPVFVSAGSSIVGAAYTVGTGAYRNDGSVGAGISYAYRSEYDFTGSWTIEFWMYHDENINTPASGDYAETIVSFGPTSFTGFLSLALSRDAFGNMRFRWYNNNRGGNPQELYAVADATYTSAFINKWRHYALVREGDNGSLHFYIDGVETSQTYLDGVIDNDILNQVGAGLYIGGTPFGLTLQSDNINTSTTIDAIIDDLRISAGVGTAGQRYTSIGISTDATFTPPTTQLPITGTLTSVVNPPGDKYGEITLGGSPTWRGTSGVTVSQQSSGNYRVSFASTYTNSNDYYVLSQGMDQGFASYVGIARSTTHVDLSINKQSDDTAVDTGALAVQIKNHI